MDQADTVGTWLCFVKWELTHTRYVEPPFPSSLTPFFNAHLKVQNVQQVLPSLNFNTSETWTTSRIFVQHTVPQEQHPAKSYGAQHSMSDQKPHTLLRFLGLPICANLSSLIILIHTLQLLPHYGILSSASSAQSPYCLDLTVWKLDIWNSLHVFSCLDWLRQSPESIQL